jgi:hypothetical protein
MKMIQLRAGQPPALSAQQGNESGLTTLQACGSCVFNITSDLRIDMCDNRLHCWLTMRKM